MYNTKELILEAAFQWKPPSDFKDEVRTWNAHKEGGKKCKDKTMVKTIRSVAKEIISEIGKRILSGNFNLTTISFPIKAMVPQSAVEKALFSTCLFPIYINRAAALGKVQKK